MVREVKSKGMEEVCGGGMRRRKKTGWDGTNE